MKNNSVLKVLSLCMVIMLVISIMACGVPTKTENGETSNDDNPVTKELEPIEFDLFLNSAGWFDLNWGEDPVSKAIKEATGVQINFKTPVDDTGQEFTLMMASDSLPDFVVQNTNTPIYFKSLESQIFEDLMPLMEEYAPEMKARMGDAYWALTTAADGKNYDYQSAMMHPNNIERYLPVGPWNPATFIRDDIYKELNEPKVDTPESMFDTLMQIKEEYPDTRAFFPGLQSAYDSSGAGESMQYWICQFGTDRYYESDGKILATYKDPKFLEGIKWLNKLYNNGLIERGDFTKTYEEFKSLRDSGKLGVYNDSIETGYYRPPANDDVKYVFAPMFKDAKILQQEGLAWSGWSITKNCDNKERAIQFMSYSIGEEGQQLQSWGIEGKDWESNTNGDPVYTDEFKTLMKEEPANYRTITGANFLYYWHLDLYDHWIQRIQMESNPEQKEALDLYMPKKNLNFYFLDIQPEANLEASAIKQKVADLYKEAFPNIVMADPGNVDALFQEFMAKAEVLGMAELEAVWTEKGLALKEIYEPYLAKIRD